MNIIIINGSPRENGITAKLLHVIEKRLINNGVKVHFVDLGKLDFSNCSGCCSCYKTGKCYMYDDAEKLSQEIAASDGIVIGSPTYASNISGILKQFIDRGHFVIEQLLYGKYAVSISTGENYGSKDTDKILRKLLSYSGAEISGRIIFNTPFNKKIESNAAIIKYAEKIADKLFYDIKNKKNHFLQKIFHNIIFNVGIKPFVIKKGEIYSGVIEKYRRLEIIK